MDSIPHLLNLIQNIKVAILAKQPPDNKSG